MLWVLFLTACGFLPQATTKGDTSAPADDTAEESAGDTTPEDTAAPGADDDEVRALTDLPTGDDPCAEPMLVRVDYTVDGDTFYATPDGGGANVKVRMIGMDTPEVAHDDPAECYGNDAWTWTAEHLEGRLAWLTFDADCLDDYGRSLAYVIRGTDSADGFINRALLRHGYATTLTIRPNDSFEQVFAQDEEDARQAGEGLWSACD